MHLVDVLCREDRVRDVYQPRLHDAPSRFSVLSKKCKTTSFGGQSFTTYERDLQSVLVWIHEFVEQSVIHVVEKLIGKLNPKWQGIIFYMPPYYDAIACTPWHLLSGFSTCGCGHDSTILDAEKYYSYLENARVQSKLTEWV